MHRLPTVRISDAIRAREGANRGNRHVRHHIAETACRIASGKSLRIGELTMSISQYEKDRYVTEWRTIWEQIELVEIDLNA